MRWHRKTGKPLIRAFVSGLAGVWLLAAAAPCAMAETDCPPPHPQKCHGPSPSGANQVQADPGCGPLAQLDCQLANENLIKKHHGTLGDVLPSPARLYRTPFDPLGRAPPVTPPPPGEIPPAPHLKDRVLLI